MNTEITLKNFQRYSVVLLPRFAAFLAGFVKKKKDQKNFFLMICSIMVIFGEKLTSPLSSLVYSLSDNVSNIAKMHFVVPFKIDSY